MSILKNVMLATIASCVSVAFAQSTLLSPAGQDPALAAQFEQAMAVKNAEKNLPALRTKILNDWRSTATDLQFDIPKWEAKLSRWLNNADAARLVQADSAIHYDHLVAILKGWDQVAMKYLAEDAAAKEQRKALKKSGLPDSTKKLGDPTTDLVYVPLTDTCRFYASSGTGTNAGFFGAPNSYSRFFSVDGSTVYAGGTAGCDTGGIEPAAVVATVTAFSNNGGGNFLLRPFSGLAGASTINLQTTGSPGNDAVANTTIVGVCQGCSNDITLVASFSSGVVSHVIIDLIGYYVPPQATPLQCVDTADSTLSIAASGGTGNVVAPACSTGYTQTATNCEASSWLMPIVFSHAGTCSARNNDSSAATLRASRTCCRVPGR
jgi:hypothetical protein